MQVIFSRAECQHIAYSFNERALRTVEAVFIGVPDLRLTFAAVSIGTADPVMLELSKDELRTLDTLLTDADPRAGSLPDGSPVLQLVEKIWRAELSGKDGRNADHDNHVLADAHDGEAVLRS